jgi:hypothetical protein
MEEEGERYGAAFEGFPALEAVLCLVVGGGVSSLGGGAVVGR